MAVDYDKSGNFIEMVAVEVECGVAIYHAMQPPTQKALLELDLVRR